MILADLTALLQSRTMLAASGCKGIGTMSSAEGKSHWPPHRSSERADLLHLRGSWYRLQAEAMALCSLLSSGCCARCRLS